MVDQLSGVGSAVQCSSGVFRIGVATDGGNQTQNNHDYQNFQQVFTGVPVHIKHVFKGECRDYLSVWNLWRWFWGFKLVELIRLVEQVVQCSAEVEYLGLVQ